MKETTTTTAPETTTTAPETTTTAPETIGKDFPRIPFESQLSIVSACLTNVAKRIDESGKGNAMIFRFAMESREDIEQEAFCLCLERANNPKYNELPLTLYVAKACGTAFSKAFYNQTKIVITEKEIKAFYGEDATPEAVIDGKEVQKTFPAPEAKLFKEDFESRVIFLVSDGLKDRAKRMIDGLESGYTVSEIAKLESISPKRALEIYQLILNATACVIAEDGESNRLEKAIESHRTINGNLSRRLESAREYAKVKGFYDKAKEKAETENELKPLTYIDRILWAGKNQSELKKLFRK